MDALDLLKTDHDRVNSLYGQFKNESGRQQKALLFENIRNDLEAHALVEEQVFYPSFRNYPEIKERIDHSFEEHAQVKTMLREISALADGSPEFDSKVDELMERVSHHVQEEENELFPMVRRVMKRGERERLGRHMQAMKHDLPGLAA